MKLAEGGTLATSDLPRIGGWVLANGIALWLVGSVICHWSPELAALTFGLVLGALQSTMVSRSWSEALAWTGLTAIVVPAAGLLVVVVLFFTAYGSGLLATWFAGALIGLVVGAGLGIAQRAVFYMRDLPGATTRIWTVGNAFAGLVVGALSFGMTPSSCGPQDVAGMASGIAFGLLTAIPLAVVIGTQRPTR